MLSRRTRTRLAVYFAGMIVLNVFVFWQGWVRSRLGQSDFTSFYVAGQILRQGRGADLYDDELQREVQHSFSPSGLNKPDSLIPYIHPPFEALAFLPLARFSYLHAYLIWLFVNMALVAAMPFVLRPHFPILGKEPLALWLLACFSFFPIFVAAVEGQDSIWLLFCYSMAYATFSADTELRSGCWLGIGLFKFHLVLPFVLALAITGRKKLVAGFLAVAALLLGVGIWVVGTKGWLEYPAYVWGYESNQSAMWKAALGKSANLRGLISTVLPATSPHLKAGVLTLFSVLLLAGLVFAWKKTLPQENNRKAMAFCIGLIVTVLLSYHLYPHDLSVVFLAILLAIEGTISISTIRAWARRTIFGCVAILSCTPVYLLLIRRYKHSEIIAGVSVILIVTLWCEIIWPGIGKKSLALPDENAFGVDGNLEESKRKPKASAEGLYASETNPRNLSSGSRAQQVPALRLYLQRSAIPTR